jgi:ornithine carbamoyltransferase
MTKTKVAAKPKAAPPTASPPAAAKLRHFIDLSDIDPKVLRRMIDNAHAMKAAGRRVPAHLRPDGIEDLVLIMIFAKPSTRTRISFDLAMRQLGGQSLSPLNAGDLQLGRGESIADTARVMSRYGDVIMLRGNAHSEMLDLAANASVPVINGLTDFSHPCQIMADIMTFEESRTRIEGATVAWVGDGNNVATSWIHAACHFGFKLRLAVPPQLNPDPAVMTWARSAGGDITLTDDPKAAVRGADCVVTDTWVSMGQTDAPRRKQLLGPYQVDEALMKLAKKDAIFLHDLPAYRGNEVTAEVIDGPQSRVWDEAENRLHAQKAILAWCLGKD